MGRVENFGIVGKLNSVYDFVYLLTLSLLHEAEYRLIQRIILDFLSYSPSLLEDHFAELTQISITILDGYT